MPWLSDTWKIRMPKVARVKNTLVREMDRVRMPAASKEQRGTTTTVSSHWHSR